MIAPLAAYDPNKKVVGQADQTEHHPRHRAGVRKFILRVIEDAWTRCHKYSETFYSRVAPLALLKILAKHVRRI